MPLAQLRASLARRRAAAPKSSEGASADLADAGALSPARFWATFAVLFLVAALPLLSVELPPLFDYPNHLARMDLLSRLPASQTLQRYYELRWRIIPNLGMDLVVPMLARIMPLAWAGKAFVLASLGLVAAGAAFVHRAAAGRWSVWPLSAFLFLYSRVLLWGFLSYLLGVGLALVAFALWISLLERSATARLTISAVAALVLFFVHLMACGIYAVLVAGYELGVLWRRRPISWSRMIARMAIAAAPFVPPLALLLFAGDGQGLGAIRFGRIDRKLDLLFSVFDNYDRVFDVGCFVVLVLAAGLGFFRRHLKVIPGLLPALGLLAVVYLAAPSQLMTASAVDHRLPLVIGLVLSAATIGPRVSSGGLRLAALACLALFLARMAEVWVHWERADAVYARLLPILDQVPEGGRVAVGYPADAVNSTAVPTTHLPVLAIVRRDAFVPTLFAYRGQQPVALTPEVERLASVAEPGAVWQALMGAGGSTSPSFILQGFDAVLLLDQRPFAMKPTPGLTPVAVEPDFALYRVER
ncbi:MAG TPA: hypothetical protein VJN67_23250 [Stellaceae bacterium]|nr:hypothetical protein [Stellaceae bacterium]